MRGLLRKLLAQPGDPVSYQLRLIGADGSETHTPLNPWLGQRLVLHFSGVIRCVHCARQTKKSFHQGYCYPCFQRLAQCDLCQMKPETCHAHLGTCREPGWADAHCWQPHWVYLSNTSDLKVGITRQGNAITRWIDQGARQAIPLYQVETRRDSGLIERLLASTLSDRTAWQTLLKGDPPLQDLTARRDQLQQTYRGALEQLDCAWQELTDPPLELDYPVLTYPTKVRALNPTQEPRIEGCLQGIKGQYLLFDQGVINLRKYAGYEVEVSGAAC